MISTIYGSVPRRRSRPLRAADIRHSAYSFLQQRHGPGSHFQGRRFSVQTNVPAYMSHRSRGYASPLPDQCSRSIHSSTGSVSSHPIPLIQVSPPGCPASLSMSLISLFVSALTVESLSPAGSLTSHQGRPALRLPRARAASAIRGNRSWSSSTRWPSVPKEPAGCEVAEVVRACATRTSFRERIERAGQYRGSQLQQRCIAWR